MAAGGSRQLHDGVHGNDELERSFEKEDFTENQTASSNSESSKPLFG